MPAIALALVGALVAVRGCVAPAPGSGLARAAAAPGDPPGAIAWEGSIYFARGGPQRIGVQTSGPARVVVAGTVLHAPGPQATCPRPPTTECLGVKLAWIVLPAGPAAIRFAGPADARLVWNPVGRRGDPEYVPASSLDARPPEAARFDVEAAGAATTDGVFALAIGAVLIALAAWSLRRRWRAAPRALAIGVAAVFVLAAAVRLYDLGGAGQTWDEDTNWEAGRNYVTNVLELDAAPRSWIWNYEHPPVMKYLAGAGAQLADGFGPARALSALAVALACALLVVIGARLYSLRVGVLAGVIAALTPHLVAHAKIVGHEAPSLLWWTLGIWLAITAHDPPNAPDGRSERGRLALRLAGLGVVLGVAVASRFVNGLLAIAIGGIVLAGAPAGARKRTIALGLAIVPVVALAVVVAVWPRLWSEPFTHLAEAWARLDKQHTPEPYLGAIVKTPPRTYFLVYLVATAPLGILLAALAWLGRAGVGVVRGALDERRAAVAVAIAFVAPLVAMASPVRQDGVRYILPSLAVLAVIAAAGVDAMASAVARAARRVQARVAFAGLGAALALYLAAVCARIHPYYLDYYGEHVGGPSGVAARRSFEIAWWGEGLDRAIDYVNAHAAPRARVHRECVAPSHLTWFRGDLWPTEQDAKRAEWIVVYQPSLRRCAPADATPVFTVSANGAPLATVYRRQVTAP